MPPEMVTLAFRTAHLLTGTLQLAERAVLQGIDRLDPDRISEDSLLQNTIAAALRINSSEPAPAESMDPVEMRAVLRLPEELRQCFVLRVLVRLPRPACARLLELNAGVIEDYTCAALQRLAGVRETHECGA